MIDGSGFEFSCAGEIETNHPYANSVAANGAELTVIAQTVSGQESYKIVIGPEDFELDRTYSLRQPDETYASTTIQQENPYLFGLLQEGEVTFG